MSALRLAKTGLGKPPDLTSTTDGDDNIAANSIRILALWLDQCYRYSSRIELLGLVASVFGRCNHLGYVGIPNARPLVRLMIATLLYTRDT